MNPMEFLKKLPADEPVFILRAQDKTAPNIIDKWADNVDRLTGGPSPKTLEARSFAAAMRKWQALNFHKVPD